MPARVVTCASTLLLLPMLLACGDESSGSSGTTADASEAEVKAFAEDYLEALRTGDPSFCDRVTPRYRKEQQAEDGDIGSCEEAFATIASWRDSDPEEWEQDFGGPVREVRVDGDRASFLYGDEGDGYAILLVRDGDDWLIDGDDGEYSYKSSLSTADDVARWERVGCDLEKGLTRDEVLDLMGEPTVEDANTWFWHGPNEDDYEFFVIFDEDDKATDYSAGGLCDH